jgi:hypothetical protein
LCILQGLERLVATNTANKLYREKIEKLAMDLLKSDNELLSIPALKLLITCMYIGEWFTEIVFILTLYMQD